MRRRPSVVSVALVVIVVVVAMGALSSASAGSRLPTVKHLPRPVGSHGDAGQVASSAPSVPVTGTPGVPGTQPARLSSTDGAAGQTALPAASVLVKFADGTPDSVRDHALSSRGATLVGPVGDTGYVKVKPSGDPADLVTALRGDRSVEAATLDYPRHTAAIPNDEFWSGGSTPQSAYLSTVRMPEAWDRIRDASSQIVAVIDTGVTTTHWDLAGHTVPGVNVVSPGTPPDDLDGHGTMVAGIVAASTNNGIGVAGVSWDGQVMPVKVTTGVTGVDSNVAVGIHFAVDHGAKVINLSVAGPGDSPLLHDAVRYATSHDVVVVAAAGNTGDNVPQFPAAYPEVLAVGATDANGALTDFSSFGDWLDLAAPGSDIISTSLNGDLATGSGTSFAAAIVSGIAALVRAEYPNLTAAQVGDRLRNSARDAGPRGVDPYYGWGVVDAAYAVGGSFGSAFQLAVGTDEPNDVPARATDLGIGTVSETIGFEGDNDWYRYDETQNRSVAITVTPAAFDGNLRNIDPVLELYNASFVRVGAVDDHGPGQAESATVPLTPGTYYVKVHNHNGAADTRPYSIAVAPAPPALFTPPQQIPVNEKSVTVAIGDVTGDGRDDVVFSAGDGPDTVFQNMLKLYVAAQQPDGSLATPVRYDPTPPATTRGLALLDVDRDGRRDVVVTATNGLEWFRQAAGGALVSQGLLPGLSGLVIEAIAHDVDGDGVDDLVVPQINAISLLTHGAGSSFSLSTVGAETATQLAVGDLDGDGRTDIAAFVGNQRVHVYHNTASGWTRTDLTMTNQGPVGSIEVADVTGDGRADLIATFGGTGAGALVGVFPQNSDGTLAAGVMYPAFERPMAVRAADVNGDGRVDVVAVSNGAHAVGVLLQQQDGTLAPDLLVPAQVAFSSRQQNLALGDIDGDGKVDVVTSGDVVNGFGSVVTLRQALGVLIPSISQEFVRSVTPAESTAGLPLNTAPQVGFALDVNPSSLTSSTVQLQDGRTGQAVPTTWSYNAGARTVTVTPTAPLHDNSPYRLVVNGVTDGAGNPQPWPFTSTFSTVDTAPPALNYTIAGGLGSVDFTFAPPIGDLDQIIVRSAVGDTPPATPTDGIPFYSGIDSGVTVGGLTPGTTYSFSLWERDRGGQLSPVRTATLVGTTVALTNAPAGSTTTVSPLTFVGHLTRADTGGAWSGGSVNLMSSCLGRPMTVLATGTSNGSGDVSITVTQPLPTCVYRLQVSGLPTFMGSASALVRVDAELARPPGTPPHTH